MLRQMFDQKLQILQDEVLLLGYRVDVALGEAVEALTCQDLPNAQRIMADTSIISGKRSRIEADTFLQIATQQPVAGDLRMLVAVLEITTELEHMRVYVADIVQVTLNLGVLPLPEHCPHILLAMAEKARVMLRQSLQAFARRDVSLAQTIPGWDDEVDQLYAEICQALTSLIKVNPAGSHQAACLLRVAHNLERTADRVLNICEWVVFTVTGEMKELNGSAR